MTVGTQDLLGTLANLRAQAATGDTEAMHALATVASMVAEFTLHEVTGDLEVEYTFDDGTTEPTDLLGPDTDRTPQPTADDGGGSRLFTRDLLGSAPQSGGATSGTVPSLASTVSVPSLFDTTEPQTPLAEVVDLDATRETRLDAPSTPVYPVITPGTAQQPTPRPVSVFGSPGAAAPLADVKQWFFARLDEGVCCPTCERTAEVHPRQISESMARSLITMYRNARTHWFHMPTMAKQWQKRDEAMLAYWGLIEKATRDNREAGAPLRGWWRVTDQGHAYLLGRLTVPQFARVYNKQVVGYEGPMVTIRDAVGVTFDVEKYMRGEAS